MTTCIPSSDTPAMLCAKRLIADGWLENPNLLKPYARCFRKLFDTPTVCTANADRPGIPIEIAITSDTASMELELCASLNDETWLILHNYALPKTVEEVTALIPRLLAIWEAANSDAINH